MSLDFSEYVFVNLTSTNDKEGKPQVIDVCALKVEAPPDAPGVKTHILDVTGWHEVIRPDMPLDDATVKETGVTDDLIAKAPSRSDTINKLLDYIGNKLVLAYNGQAVASLMLGEAKLVNRTIENNFVHMGRDYFPVELPHAKVDSLDAVCKYFGIADNSNDRKCYVDALRLIKAYMATLDRSSKIKNGEPLDEPVKLSYTKPPFDGAEIAFVDVETTGLQPESCNITEISVQIYKQGKGIVNSYTSLVRIDKPLPAEIVRLTRITDEMLASAPSISEALTAALATIGRRTDLI